MEWVQKKFDKAMLPYHVNKGDFKPEHSRVIEFPKIWKENAIGLFRHKLNMF